LTWAKLIKDSRAVSNSRPAYYFTLTVAGGAVHRIQEDKTFNAC
jgi:Fic family protein